MVLYMISDSALEDQQLLHSLVYVIEFKDCLLEGFFTCSACDKFSLPYNPFCGYRLHWSSRGVVASHTQVPQPQKR